MRKALLFTIILVLNFVNCNIDGESQSEPIDYKGVIKIEGVDSIPNDIEIYSSNLDSKIVDSNGSLVKTQIKPDHPNKEGVFITGVTTYSHSASETVHHWQCGPLRLFIRHPDYFTYCDSLSNEQLKELKQNAAGQWLLPLITLQKRK